MDITLAARKRMWTMRFQHILEKCKAENFVFLNFLGQVTFDFRFSVRSNVMFPFYGTFGVLFLNNYTEN